MSLHLEPAGSGPLQQGMPRKFVQMVNVGGSSADPPDVYAEPWFGQREGQFNGKRVTVINTAAGAALAAGESIRFQLHAVEADGTITALDDITFGAGTASGQQAIGQLTPFETLVPGLPAGTTVLRVTTTYTAGGGPTGIDGTSCTYLIWGSNEPPAELRPFTT